MATMDLNTWLKSILANQIGPSGFGNDYDQPNWWYGKTVETLTPEEKLRIVREQGPQLTGQNLSQTPEQTVARGAFDYNQPKESGILEDMSPFLMMASLAAGAGALNGGLFGGAEALGAGAGAEAPMTGWGAGFEGAGAGGTMLDVTPTDTWTNPSLEPEARGFRAPTSAAPRSTVNPWDNVNIAGNYAPVVDLPYTANPSELSGLPGAGGTPYSGSPLPGGTGDPWPGLNQFAGPATGTGPQPWSPDMPDVGGEWDFQIPDSGAGLRDLSQLPPATNLQDLLTKTDPAYQLGRLGLPANVLQTVMGQAGGTGGGTTQAGGTGGTAGAIGRIMDGNPTTADWLSVGGIAGATGLGLLGANSQSSAYERLANQFAEYGAPYRAQLASISQDPNQFYNSPTGQGALNAVLQKLSVGGNPAGDPYKQALATSSLYDKYSQERGLLGTLGGLSAYNAAAPGMAGQAAGTQSKIYDVLGYGLNQATQPQNDLASLLKRMGMTTSAA